jgi:enoyl-CoA hydratase
MDLSVQAWREGRAGRIRLNRPKALNALDLEMVKLIREALAAFGTDPLVQVILLDAPERGFCAGGDIRMLRAGSLAGDVAAVREFFTLEYAMNLEISDLRKPFVSLIDGVCMGGGIGISVHGSHRIASEKAVFAMPETAIALFPDVGATYALPRLPGELGMYLGLTGARLAGPDAVHAGLATHFVPSAKLGELAAAIVQDGVAVISEYAEAFPAFSLAAQRRVIDEAFSAESVREILLRLEADGSEFALATLDSLREHSPSAVCWSFEILRRGATRNLKQCLAGELALVMQVAMGAEFLEGVRAMVVDKDKSPKWQPSSIEEVDPDAISAFFA